MNEQDDEGLRREPRLSDGLGALPAAASTAANASQKSRSGASAPEAATDAAWERGLLEKLLMSTLAEQRTARRWRNVFRFLALGAFLITLG
ncbi:MAG: S49 family peptidase, partial [Burkholderiales bacterium]